MNQTRRLRNSLTPAASAVVTDEDGRILLHRRSDNDLWSIPGGAMEIGESIAETAVRETREETGLDVRPLYVVGVYSNPGHVVEYSDGEVRQQFSVLRLRGRWGTNCVEFRIIGRSFCECGRRR